jgi:hypothetical protein
MAIDLEKELEDLCEQSAPRLDLYARLVRVRASAEAIWAEQRLKWFTDHRATTHSRYIIKHLGSVLERLQDTSQRLTPHELYVLLASCYLHDIGMQDFTIVDGRGVEQLTETDYKRIRDRHPERGKELIIARTLRRERDDFRIDLDDDPQYLVPIALVSQGHGSSFYVETVKELRELPNRPGNEARFRGGLLAALLLIGDELDLHERRAKFPQEFSLSPASLLHHYVHHYVTSVEVVVGRTPKHRRIRLTLQFPQDSDEFRPDVRDWIVAKLRRQSELTNPEIEESTDGELAWDSTIEIRETTDRYGVRRSLMESPASMKALHELRRDVVKGQRIDRDELIKALREGIDQSRQCCQIIRVLDFEDSDWSQTTRELSAICNSKGVALVHIAFKEAVGRGPLDVLTRVAKTLARFGLPLPSNYALPSPMRETQDAPRLAGQALITELLGLAESSPIVLLLERVDTAELTTLNWLIGWFLPELSRQNVKLLAVVTELEGSGLEKVSPNEQLFSLLPYTKDQIAEHFRVSQGFSPGRAEDEASYLFSLTSGSPSRLHSGLARRRLQGLSLVDGSGGTNA